MRAATLVTALAVLAGACAVDTELGVAAEIQSASITVTGTGDANVVAVSLETRFRVGEHAMGERQFVVQRAELFIDDTPAALVNLSYSNTLAPGDDETVTLMGSTSAGAFPNAPMLLCDASDVEVVVRWQDIAPGETPTETDFQLAQLTTTNVRCE